MDHLKPKQRKLNPEGNTNIFLRFFFIYTRHILQKGFQKEITEDDLYEVRPNFKTKKLGDLLETVFNVQEKKSKHSVLLILWKSFGKEYFLILISLVIPMTLTFLQPKFVKKFILCFTLNRDKLNSDGYFYGSLLVLVAFFQALYFENFGLCIEKLTLKIRASLTCLIYRRALEMKNVDKTSIGKIVNLITRDIVDFEKTIFEVSWAVKETLSCLIICIVLYLETGWVSLSLVAIFLAILCVNYYFAILVKKIKLKSLRKTDERYQITKEVLNAIKLIKCYLWQDAYKEKVCSIRNKEVGYISKINFLLFTKFTLAELVSDASWYVIVVILICSGGRSNAGILFLILNSMNQLVFLFRYVLPATMHTIAKLITVSRRIENFLKSTSKSYVDGKDQVLVPKIELSNVKIKVENGDFLHFSNFKTDPGITALTGSVGSGKSLLLKTIAKEHEEVEGSLKVSGSISYASQEPWLFPSTIKQNILFGSDYEAKRYLMVLEVCGLRQDLQQLEEGDATIVADRGVNLSKGQQARINLARAIYKDCDIYLLDDCLSSLDVLVADFIFEECIKKFLKGKIVLMVTQNNKHISGADNVIILRNGTAEFRDTSTDSSIGETVETRNYSTGEIECKNDRFLTVENFDETRSLMETIETEKRLYLEKKARGKVQFDIYKKYIESSGGIIKLTVISIFFIIIQILKRIINKLESNWINHEQIIFSNSTNRILYTRALENRSQMFYVLPTLFAVVAIMTLLKVKIFWRFVGNASINLHKLLFERVTNASMEFFDSRFIGTILNRFSEDFLHIDEKVPFFLINIIKFVIEMVSVVVLIGTVSPLFIILCLINTTILIYVRFLYLKTGRALKRLEFTSRSPLIGHFNATMEGLSVIRVSKMQKILREELDRHQDLYTSASYISMCCEKAFLFVADLFSVFIIFAVINYFLVWHNDTSVGNIGLVLSHIFRFAAQDVLLFRLWSRLENEMTSVERVLEFTKVKQENTDGFVVEKWPSEGIIRFEDLSFSYNTKTSVLKDLNFVIGAKEKVAIVGRTASGKTSLISTLLRLYKFEGKISIDDVEISTLHLQFYRSQISIIPQDPILFTGTLRENIDPTNKYKDDEIWKSLKAVNLKIFETLEDGINATDSNLSVGQKQLICLSRALIRKSKIIILDEITANVDSATQDLIHDIIFKQFKDSTVIEITHKLDHILKYDKVMVMEKGKLVQIGHPRSLLENHDLSFYKMWRKTK